MTRNKWTILVFVCGIALLWLAVGVGVGTKHQRDEPIAGQPSTRNPLAGHAPEPASAEPTPSPQTPPKPGPQAPVAKNEPPAAKAPVDANSPEAVPIPAPERSGPVDELKSLFASEVRASAAAHVEAAIETQFRRPEVRSGLLKSVLCRTSVCRVETRWSPERAESFMSAFMHLMADPTSGPTAFDPQFAISPEGEASADGSGQIDVYVRLVAAPAKPDK